MGEVGSGLYQHEHCGHDVEWHGKEQVRCCKCGQEISMKNCGKPEHETNKVKR